MSIKDETLDRSNTHLAIKIADQIVAWLPWVWMLAFAIFTAIVVMQIGRLPTYGSPDPKYAGAISMMHAPLMMLLLLTYATAPFGLLGALKEFSRSNASWPFLRLAGILLFLAVALFDVTGLMDWLLD